MRYIDRVMALIDSICTIGWARRRIDYNEYPGENFPPIIGWRFSRKPCPKQEMLLEAIKNASSPNWILIEGRRRNGLYLLIPIHYWEYVDENLDNIHPDNERSYAVTNDNEVLSQYNDVKRVYINLLRLTAELKE